MLSFEIMVEIANLFSDIFKEFPLFVIWCYEFIESTFCMLTMKLAFREERQEPNLGRIAERIEKWSLPLRAATPTVAEADYHNCEYHCNHKCDRQKAGLTLWIFSEQYTIQ